MWLHLSHRGHSAGDTYSSWVDHAQPPLAVLLLLSLPLTLAGRLAWIPAGLLGLLLLLQIPMTFRLVRRLPRPRYLCFAPMSLLRAFWRGVGMLQGLAAYVLRKGIS